MRVYNCMNPPSSARDDVFGNETLKYIRTQASEIRDRHTFKGK